MPNTPSGTRICPTLMPLGRRLTPVISPTGSGIAAICSQPSATVSMIAGVSFRRSTSGAARPAARARQARARSCCVGGLQVLARMVRQLGAGHASPRPRIWSRPALDQDETLLPSK
jgi:hypothetical protein